jgi:hypothetical protein
MCRYQAKVQSATAIAVDTASFYLMDLWRPQPLACLVFEADPGAQGHEGVTEPFGQVQGAPARSGRPASGTERSWRSHLLARIHNNRSGGRGDIYRADVED